MTAAVGVVVTAQVTQDCRLEATEALQMQAVVVHEAIVEEKALQRVVHVVCLDSKNSKLRF